MWTCLDVHNCTASLTCSKTLISITQLGDACTLECSARLYFPRQNLSSEYPTAGENQGARRYFQLKQSLPHRNEQSLKTSGISSKPSSTRYIDLPQRAVPPSSWLWLQLWYRFHSWSTEEPATPVQGHPLATKAGLHSGSILCPPSAGFGPSFPGLTSTDRSQRDPQAQQRVLYFCSQPHRPDPGCHAASWTFCWRFTPRYQAPWDKLPLKNLILIQTL